MEVQLLSLRVGWLVSDVNNFKKCVKNILLILAITFEMMAM
jgi:hypothetical protein